MIGGAGDREQPDPARPGRFEDRGAFVGGRARGQNVVDQQQLRVRTRGSVQAKASRTFSRRATRSRPTCGRVARVRMSPRIVR